MVFDTNTRNLTLDWENDVTSTRTGYGIFPLYQRGYYFSAGFFEVTPVGQCEMALSGVVLAPTFTLELWIWPVDLGTMFSISRNEFTGAIDETFLSVAIANPGWLSILFGYGQNIIVDAKASDNNLVFPMFWHYIKINVVWEESLKSSTLTASSDTNVHITENFLEPVLDQEVYFHNIGFEYNVVNNNGVPTLSA